MKLTIKQQALLNNIKTAKAQKEEQFYRQFGYWPEKINASYLLMPHNEYIAKKLESIGLITISADDLNRKIATLTDHD